MFSLQVLKTNELARLEVFGNGFTDDDGERRLLLSTGFILTLGSGPVPAYKALRVYVLLCASGKCLFI